MRLSLLIIIFALSQGEGFSHPSNLLANSKPKLGTEIPKYFVRPREMAFDPRIMKDVKRLIDFMMTDMKEINRINQESTEQIRKGKITFNRHCQNDKTNWPRFTTLLNINVKSLYQRVC